MSDGPNGTEELAGISVSLRADLSAFESALSGLAESYKDFQVPVDIRFSATASSAEKIGQDLQAAMRKQRIRVPVEAFNLDALGKQIIKAIGTLHVPIQGYWDGWIEGKEPKVSIAITSDPGVIEREAEKASRRNTTTRDQQTRGAGKKAASPSATLADEGTSTPTGSVSKVTGRTPEHKVDPSNVAAGAQLATHLTPSPVHNPSMEDRLRAAGVVRSGNAPAARAAGASRAVGRKRGTDNSLQEMDITERADAAYAALQKELEAVRSGFWALNPSIAPRKGGGIKVGFPDLGDEGKALADEVNAMLAHYKIGYATVAAGRPEGKQGRGPFEGKALNLAKGGAGTGSTPEQQAEVQDLRRTFIEVQNRIEKLTQKPSFTLAQRMDAGETQGIIDELEKYRAMGTEDPNMADELHSLVGVGYAYGRQKFGAKTFNKAVANYGKKGGTKDGEMHDLISALKAYGTMPRTEREMGVNLPDEFGAPFTFLSGLGGSTGAELHRDEATGKKVVLKRGANAGHLREESIADRLYEAAGVRVAPHQLLETESGPLKVADFIEGSQLLPDALATADPRQRAGILEDLQGGFATDALLANWDVIGMQSDNVVVKDGKAYRIDNGGALRYRAMGAPKGDMFGTHVGETSSLRERGTAAQYFGGLSDAAVRAQVIALSKRRQQMLEAAPEELRGVLGARFDDLQSQYDVLPDTFGAPTYPIPQSIKGNPGTKISEYEAALRSGEYALAPSEAAWLDQITELEFAHPTGILNPVPKYWQNHPAAQSHDKLAQILFESAKSAGPTSLDDEEIDWLTKYTANKNILSSYGPPAPASTGPEPFKWEFQPHHEVLVADGDEVEQWQMLGKDDYDVGVLAPHAGTVVKDKKAGTLSITPASPKIKFTNPDTHLFGGQSLYNPSGNAATPSDIWTPSMQDAHDLQLAFDNDKFTEWADAQDADEYSDMISMLEDPETFPHNPAGALSNMATFGSIGGKSPLQVLDDLKALQPGKAAPLPKKAPHWRRDKLYDLREQSLQHRDTRLSEELGRTWWRGHTDLTQPEYDRMQDYGGSWAYTANSFLRGNPTRPSDEAWDPTRPDWDPSTSLWDEIDTLDSALNKRRIPVTGQVWRGTSVRMFPDDMVDEAARPHMGRGVLSKYDFDSPGVLADRITSLRHYPSSDPAKQTYHRIMTRLAAMLRGSETTDLGYMSTAMDPGNAGGFESGVLLDLEVPRGTPGRPLAGSTRTGPGRFYSDKVLPENELLIGRGRRIRWGDRVHFNPHKERIEASPSILPDTFGAMPTREDMYDLSPEVVKGLKSRARKASRAQIEQGGYLFGDVENGKVRVDEIFDAVSDPDSTDAANLKFAQGEADRARAAAAASGKKVVGDFHTHTGQGAVFSAKDIAGRAGVGPNHLSAVVDAPTKTAAFLMGGREWRQDWAAMGEGNREAPEEQLTAAGLKIVGSGSSQRFYDTNTKKFVSDNDAVSRLNAVASTGGVTRVHVVNFMDLAGVLNKVGMGGTGGSGYGTHTARSGRLELDERGVRNLIQKMRDEGADIPEDLVGMLPDEEPQTEGDPEPEGPDPFPTARRVLNEARRVHGESWMATLNPDSMPNELMTAMDKANLTKGTLTSRSIPTTMIEMSQALFGGRGKALTLYQEGRGMIGEAETLYRKANDEELARQAIQKEAGDDPNEDQQRQMDEFAARRDRIRSAARERLSQGEEMVDEAGSAGRVASILGSGFAGGIVGSFVFGAAFQAFSAAVGAAVEAMDPLIQRMTSFGRSAQETTASLGQASFGAGGRTGNVNLLMGQLGIDGETAARLEPILKAQADRGSAMIAFDQQKTLVESAYNFGVNPQQGILTPTGGTIFGLGGEKPLIEKIGNMIEQSDVLQGRTAEEGARIQQQLNDLVNVQLAGSGMQVQTGASPEEVERQRRETQALLPNPGLADSPGMVMLNALRDRGAALVDDEGNALSGEQIIANLDQLAKGVMPNPAELLKARMGFDVPQAEFMSAMQAQLKIDQINPASRALARLATPRTPISAGIGDLSGLSMQGRLMLGMGAGTEARLAANEGRSPILDMIPEEVQGQASDLLDSIRTWVRRLLGFDSTSRLVRLNFRFGRSTATSASCGERWATSLGR
jgi:proteasome lid subunit RPN8/RPN11